MELTFQLSHQQYQLIVSDLKQVFSEVCECTIWGQNVPRMIIWILREKKKEKIKKSLRESTKSSVDS